eukprot:gene18826-20722_t
MSEGVRFTVIKADKDESKVEVLDAGKESADNALSNSSKSPLLGREECGTNNEAGNLALYEEDIKKRPKLATLLATLSNYDVTIPVSKNKGEDVKPKSKDQKVVKMGTLAGVYLPCLQNIFGVILFIRLSWIVGTAGVLQSFVIVLLCCCCTMLTAVSMSAIATNGMVPGGGSYFMISRSLGREFGGAVGILFYLGTTFASSMYILGAIEILLTYIAPSMSLFGDVSGGGTQSPAMLNNMRVYGTILLITLAFLVFVGVKIVNKFASLFLLCVLLSILAIYVGFFSIHARSSTDICFVGERLMPKHLYNSCSKNDTKLGNFFMETQASYLYWNQSSVFIVNGAPGITSGVFSDNIASQYVRKGQTIKGTSPFPGSIVADITSSFTVLLAIFFPSVTGIMAGSNRSGNLKDAQRSIPRGTIAAIATTMGESIGGSLIVANIAWPSKWVVLIGSFLSTVGAGLQSLTGAPRLLQAISKDGIIPFLNVFATSSKGGEPQRALLLTIAISEIGIIIASLDAVAPIITMFFLMCYGFVNFACALQSLLKAPNWRPRFRFYHWLTSAIGVAFCLSLMFISSWYYAIVAIVVAVLIYKYIEYRGAEKEWGDGLRGLSLSAARYSLLKLEQGSLHTKNWRPQVLVLCTTMKSPEVDEKSKNVITLVSQLKAGRGLTIVGSVVHGDYTHNTVEVDESKENLQEVMKAEKVKGFCKVIAAKDLSEGYSFLIQNGGLGGLTPNTVIIAWPQDWKESLSLTAFINTVRVTSERHEALVVVKDADSFPDRKDRQEGFIDVWWIVHDGELEDNSIQMKKDLSKFLYNLRIAATIEVVEMLDQDICAYTYERTLMMEQRKVLLEKMKLSRRESRVEKETVNGDDGNALPPDAKKESNFSLKQTYHTKPKGINLQRMNTAVKLNAVIKEKSEDSKLIMINLPTPPRSLQHQEHYMEFIDVLTEGLHRVILVRGGGHEVVTIYS